MSSLLTKQNLIPVVAVLVLLKFIAVPVWEWQESKISEIQQLKGRLDRAELLSSKGGELQEVLEAAKESNVAKAKSLYIVDDLAALKLNKMNELDQLLSSYNVRITSSSWMSETGDVIKKFNLKVGVRGKTKEVIQAILALRKLEKLSSIDDLSIRIVKMQDKTLGDAGGSLVIGFYVLDSALMSKLDSEANNVAE